MHYDMEPSNPCDCKSLNTIQDDITCMKNTLLRTNTKPITREEAASSIVELSKILTDRSRNVKKSIFGYIYDCKTVRLRQSLFNLLTSRIMDGMNYVLHRYGVFIEDESDLQNLSSEKIIYLQYTMESILNDIDKKNNCPYCSDSLHEVYEEDDIGLILTFM